MEELKKVCVERIEESFERATKKYGIEFFKPRIVWSNRMTATAGTARVWFTPLGRIKDAEIKLSVPLLKANGMSFVNDTPSHEAAHVIAMEVYGRQASGHGKYWKEAMRVVGNAGKRCHNLKTPGRELYEYLCPQSGKSVTLGPIQHKRAQTKGIRYGDRKQVSVGKENFVKRVS